MTAGLGPVAAGDVIREFGITTRPADPSAYMDSTGLLRAHYIYGGSFSGSKLVPNAHLGRDIANVLGTPITAAERGVVLLELYDVERGYLQLIGIHKNANGRWDTVLEYQHLMQTGRLPVGTHVDRGQRTANMGSTGDSTGPHIHWALAHSFYAYADYRFWQHWFQYNPARFVVGGDKAGTPWIVPNF